MAPLPAGITTHFGPELKRFVLAQYHQGQTTIPRLLALLDEMEADHNRLSELVQGKRESETTTSSA